MELLDRNTQTTLTKHQQIEARQWRKSKTAYKNWKHIYWLIRTIYSNGMNACFMQHQQKNTHPERSIVNKTVLSESHSSQIHWYFPTSAKRNIHANFMYSLWLAKALFEPYWRNNKYIFHSSNWRTHAEQRRTNEHHLTKTREIELACSIEITLMPILAKFPNWLNSLKFMKQVAQITTCQTAQRYSIKIARTIKNDTHWTPWCINVP